MLYSLTGYEYPLLISLATLAMFLSLSANNWIILFLALELQALCFDLQVYGSQGSADISRPLSLTKLENLL